MIKVFTFPYSFLIELLSRNLYFPILTEGKNVLKSILLSLTKNNQIEEISSHFCIAGEPESSGQFGNGNVNDTYLITCSDKDGKNVYTLQRINHFVFKDPVALMNNFERVTSHLLSKSIEQNHGKDVLTLIPTRDGKSFHLDVDGHYWRMTKFIAGGKSFDVPEHDGHAFEAAKAFGQFQANLNDLGEPALVETIPAFHNTRKRFDRFTEMVSRNPKNRLNEVEDLVELFLKHEKLADAIKRPEFPRRVVHNDTKLNNVLLHQTTGKAICVVDLDTVMPGCALHDFGDLVRTAANAADEDETDLSKVQFLPSRFEAIMDGYLLGCQGMLIEKEIKKLAIAPIAITYELALRFLTDFLEGDLYFKTHREGHNIERAKSQFTLMKSMLTFREEMEELIRTKRDLF